MHVWRFGSPFQSVVAHERALAALRDISERAPFATEPARDEPDRRPSIQVFDDRASSQRRAPGPAARGEATARRRNAAKHDRPTIASIPTVGWRPARPAETEHVPETAS